MSYEDHSPNREINRKNIDRDKGRSIVSVALLYSFFNPYLLNLFLASFVLEMSR